MLLAYLKVNMIYILIILEIMEDLFVKYSKSSIKMKSIHLFFKLLPAFFVFSCLSFSPENKHYEVKTYHSLSKPFTDTLFFPIENEDEMITSIEMEISGYVNGGATLEIENGAGRYFRLKLEGKLDEKYHTEWYQNNFEIRYLPTLSFEGDSLKIRYRMQ
ncbi:MAG: hypothetical protein CO119_12105 [Flavobacteriales bacterium CG_4_9_14_3_um_filter_40_17]|nr:MAG: hypothetical protein CO119_12105 [Flavobacteriales bacterium CG_4_9_14_3_um_filter_40_17]